MNDSAVAFEAVSRVHVGLGVRDLEASVAFYRVLFGQEPTKTRPGYAKFEVAQPALNLSLNATTGGTAPSNPAAHFGIQVKSSDVVREMASRLRKAGLSTRSEERVECCYAVQTKVWAVDPDGNPWEVFVVLDNDAGRRQPSSGACCAESSLDAAAAR
jgi:catechol 2,3-dioxygenase-like lactoylglutathione lyase family enzyme